MKILIVGAGIAGLALAAHLQEQQHDITIIEKRPLWDQRSYAITLYNNGLQTLEKFGIAEKLKKKGFQYIKTSIRDERGRMLKELYYAKLVDIGGLYLTILRKEVHSALLSLHPNMQIRMGLTVLHLQEQIDGVLVTFADETQETFDIVVGADGVGSCVRELVFSKNARKFTGGEYWTAIIPSLPSYKGNDSQTIVYRNKMLLLYHFDDSPQVCIAFGMAVDKRIQHRLSSVRALQDAYADFDYVVPAILKKLPPYNEMYHGFLSEVILKKWYTKRIVLIGDAAHAISPINGMGTSMALEDAQVLAEELANITKETVTVAFERYYARRKNRVVIPRNEGRILTMLVKMGNTYTNRFRNFLISLLPAGYFVRKVKRTVTYTI